MTRREKSLFITLAFILLLVFIMSLSGCSDKATRNLRKADKYLKKAIAAGAIVNPDTVYKPIAVFIPQVVKDTVFESIQGDTVRIEKERLRIKYVNLPGDSVYIYGESKADTIIKEVPVTVTQNVTVPVKDNKWKWIALALGVVLILAFVLRR